MVLEVADWVDLFHTFKSGIDFISRFTDLRERYRAGTMFSTADLLLECAKSEASNKLDKFWALLGICGGFGAEKLTPNYAPSEKALFRRVAEHTITPIGSESRSSLLGMAGCNHPANEIEPRQNWLSWVPDLACLPRMYPLSNASCPYRVGRGLESDVEFQSSREMRITGFALDRIEVVTRNNPWHEWDGGAEARDARLERAFSVIESETVAKEEAKKHFTWLKGIKRETVALYDSHGKSTSSYIMAHELLLEAILRTLIANRDFASFLAADRIIEALGLALYML